jgi:hypothetical protein
VRRGGSEGREVIGVEGRIRTKRENRLGEEKHREERE